MTTTTMIARLDIAIAACIASALAHGWDGSPAVYELTEADCESVADEMDGAGIAVDIKSRRRLASIHDACAYHDEMTAAA